MKKKNYIVTIVIMILSYVVNNYAHKEWIHQWQVKQAYLLLKNEIGFDIQGFVNHMGMNHTGIGNGPFKGNSIVQAAWEEDLYDPVWEVGGLSSAVGVSYCGWDPSSTHFWQADAGDYSSIDIPLDVGNCPLENGEIPNAYWKALHYIYGGWVLKWKPTETIRIRLPNGHTYRFEKLILETPLCITFQYASLVDLYKTGKIYFVWNPKSNYRIYDEKLGKYISFQGYFPLPTG